MIDYKLPEGIKSRIAEYRDVKSEQFGKITTIETRERGAREYRLVHKSAGYQPAGSIARWSNEAFGVLFEMGGATSGRWFLTESEARAMFTKWTAA